MNHQIGQTRCQENFAKAVLKITRWLSAYYGWVKFTGNPKEKGLLRGKMKTQKQKKIFVFLLDENFHQRGSGIGSFPRIHPKTDGVHVTVGVTEVLPSGQILCESGLNWTTIQKRLEQDLPC